MGNVGYHQKNQAATCLILMIVMNLSIDLDRDLIKKIKRIKIRNKS